MSRIGVSIGHRGCRLRHADFEEAKECEGRQRARSTLTLLSRFALLMWLEATAYAGFNAIEEERAYAVQWAIERGLLRVVWP